MEAEDGSTIEGAPPDFYPSSTTLGTSSFSRFLTEYRSNIDFLFFVLRVVENSDTARIQAAKALLIGETDASKRKSLEDTLAKPKLTLNVLRKHSTVVTQNLTNGIVSTFQRYFASIIHSAAHQMPSVMASSQTIKIDDVLRFSEYQELVSFIIDRKVNELSYGGLSEMEKYFKDRLGIDMFEDSQQRSLLRFFVECRNINVHNAGYVNDLFSSRVGEVDGFEYTPKKRLHLNFDDLVKLSENAMRVASSIDKAVSSKFNLERRTHDAWKLKA